MSEADWLKYTDHQLDNSFSAVLYALAKARKATVSLVMTDHLFVRSSACNNLVSTGRIFMKFDI
jgi:hypothetical protein